MSNIAIALDKLIKESNPPIKGAELARMTRIEAAQISRIRNGLQVWVKPEDLDKIAHALCPDPSSKRFTEIHARLVHARCLDVCTGPGASLVQIKLLTEPAAGPESVKRGPVLPPSLQSDLDLIAKNIAQDRNIRDLVASVAKLCRGKRLSEPS